MEYSSRFQSFKFSICVFIIYKDILTIYKIDTLFMDTYSQSGSGGHIANVPANIELNGWTEQHEEIFAEWADKAMCFRWLHNRSLKNI